MYMVGHEAISMHLNVIAMTTPPKYLKAILIIIAGEKNKHCDYYHAVQHVREFPADALLVFVTSQILLICC